MISMSTNDPGLNLTDVTYYVSDREVRDARFMRFAEIQASDILNVDFI